MHIQSVCDVTPQKKETNRVRLMAGGKTIKYPGEVSTTTADINNKNPIGTSPYMNKEVDKSVRL